MKEERREYAKAWREAHKEEIKAANKAWYEAHKEHYRDYQKVYKEAHKDQAKAYMKAYMKAYSKSDVNALGQTKQSIRQKSKRILKQMNLHIDGYEIHHCFGYEDPSKFIYCSIEMHRTIHQFLRDNNISADSDHYKYIEHLLDDSVVKYGFN